MTEKKLYLSEALAENLKRIMVYIRSDISDPDCTETVSLLLDALCQRITNDEMYGILAKHHWAEQLLNGTEHPVLDEYGYSMIKDVTEHLLMCLRNGEYETAYMLSDALHVLPDVLIMNENSSKRSFRKDFIVPFEKKTGDTVFEKYKNFFSPSLIHKK